MGSLSAGFAADDDDMLDVRQLIADGVDGRQQRLVHD